MPTIGSLKRAIANKRLSIANEARKQREIARLNAQLSTVSYNLENMRKATARMLGKVGEDAGTEVNLETVERGDDYWNK